MASATVSKLHPAWLLAPVGVGAVALVLATQSRDKPQDLAAGATATCKQVVMKMLREPESVRWEEISPWIIEPGSTTYVVRMTYRARNGFGGMARETRECKVRHDGPAGWFFIGIE